MKGLKSLSLSLAVLTSLEARALVDYTESSNSEPARSTSRPQSVQRVDGNSSRSLTWKADYSLITNYEAMEISGNKVGVMNVAAHVQTPFNIYLEGSYWHANTENGSQAGNPKFILGFNWLRFGSPSEEARLNLYGGMRLSAKDELATSRTDKIFGAETTKRFGTFGLGLGYDLTMTGTKKRSDEMQVGNIHRIVASAGWMVSNDIQFEIEAENFKVSPSTKGAGLSEATNFSTLSPKLNLGLAPAVNLELGARFRMKKAKESLNLASAGLFDLHGVQSNSLFAGLNLSI